MTFRFIVAVVGVCLAGTPAIACDNGPFPIQFVRGTATLSHGAAAELDNSRGLLDVYLRDPAFAKRVRLKISIFARTASGQALSPQLQRKRAQVIRSRLVANGIPSSRQVFVAMLSGRSNRMGNAPASIELVQGCR